MRNLLAILLMTLVAQGSWAQEKYWEKYFTDILLAGGSSSSVRKQDGWKSYDKDLNDGAKGDYIYLLYKQAERVIRNRNLLRTASSGNWHPLPVAATSAIRRAI